MDIIIRKCEVCQEVEKITSIIGSLTLQSMNITIRKREVYQKIEKITREDPESGMKMTQE